MRKITHRILIISLNLDVGIGSKVGDYDIIKHLAVCVFGDLLDIDVVVESVKIGSGLDEFKVCWVRCIKL